MVVVVLLLPPTIPEIEAMLLVFTRHRLREGGVLHAIRGSWGCTGLGSREDLSHRESPAWEVLEDLITWLLHDLRRRHIFRGPLII